VAHLVHDTRVDPALGHHELARTPQEDARALRAAKPLGVHVVVLRTPREVADYLDGLPARD
jgi:hypothetical protein